MLRFKSAVQVFGLISASLVLGACSLDKLPEDSNTQGAAGTDGTPDNFTFPAQSNVAPSTVIVSAAAAISGINIPVSISVSGGQYSIGCTSTFRSDASTITNGQTVCVRHTSAAAPLTATTTTLTVASASASFTSTTAAAVATATEFLLPYYNGSGNIYGYSTAAGTSTLLDSAVPAGLAFSPHVLTSAHIDPVSGAVSDFHPALLVYAKNGVLYRTSLAIGSSASTPAQVSSYTDICAVATLLQDFANPENSWIVVRRAGAGGDCNNFDQNPTAVRASAGATASGVMFGQNNGYNDGFTAVHDASGHIASVLTVEGISPSVLRRYDANLQSPTDLMQTSQAYFPLIGHELWTRSVYLSASSFPGGTQQLVRYDEQTRQAHVVYQFSNGMSSEISFDANNAYFADVNKLIRVPHTATVVGGATVVTTLPSPGDAVFITKIFRTVDGHIGLNAFDSSNTGMDGAFVVAADSTDAAPLKVMGHGGVFFASSGNHFFGTTTDFSTSPTSYSTMMANSDGSGVVTQVSSRWIGGTTAQQFTLPAEIVNPSSNGAVPTQLATLLREDDSVSPAVLQAVSPTDGTVLRTFSAAALTSNTAATAGGFGNAAFVMVYGLNGSASYNYDLFGLNLSSDTALNPLNNTPSDDQDLY